jgi:AcrR family transcriptional regulator
MRLLSTTMKSESPTQRRIGRPLSFDRDAVLRQAMLAFWQHGYETTSISDLTQVMGITPPSLYTAFGDKKRLFLEAMLLYAGPPDHLQQALDLAPTSRQAAHGMLQAAAVAFTGQTTPKGCLLASATASGSRDMADVQQAVAEVRRDILRRLSRRIEQDVDAGKLPPNTAVAPLAALIVAVIQGMSVLARDGMDHNALLALADAALLGWPDQGRPT